MASVYLAPPRHVQGGYLTRLPFPALILGSWPGITHSCEILPPLAEGKGCFHSWKAHLPQRCYALTLGTGFSVTRAKLEGSGPYGYLC